MSAHQQSPNEDYAYLDRLDAAAEAEQQAAINAERPERELHDALTGVQRCQRGIADGAGPGPGADETDEEFYQRWAPHIAAAAVAMRQLSILEQVLRELPSYGEVGEAVATVLRLAGSGDLAQAARLLQRIARSPVVEAAACELLRRGLRPLAIGILHPKPEPEPVPKLPLDTATEVIAPSANAIECVGQIWHLRYQGEYAEFPVQGNLCLKWLAQIVTSPRRTLTVAGLRGDPEGKLKADASLGNQYVADDPIARAILIELDDVDATIEATGNTERLEEKRAALLKELDTKQLKRFASPLEKTHHSMATQIRKFCKGLADQMPGLHAHLKVSLQLASPHFLYNPPAGTPAWNA
jgi:hypothetical protein